MFRTVLIIFFSLLGFLVIGVDNTTPFHLLNSNVINTAKNNDTADASLSQIDTIIYLAFLSVNLYH